ncbi:BtrH N-terminal domain-containing protein [uncultured Anaerofustis sp.]|uniref:BtrH N-terminal domain-containing protein n=1 Tax=uncultured Anaerofustis sp. TaxID=904996 RepID=UPI0025DAE81C|nr:BtrH N-terminal domain-containing protein [uncultured Anaerofustis sp.]
MKKILTGIKHHLDDYECMWNGIEDIYMNKTKEKIPDQFFFSMAGFCGFTYLKTNKADIKRMVAFGEGRTKQMYKYLAPIVGFDYHFIECRTPKLSLMKAKKEIDRGKPIVIGAFDMYYLEYYPKLYHKEHIPFHYFLMIGYDDEKEKIYLYDCGREDIRELSYENVLLGMNAEYPGLCKPNTICKISMDKPNDKKYIIKKCLEDKANSYVTPPTNFMGIKGIKKLANELSKWEEEIGKEKTRKVILNMIDFFGSVPKTPNRLLGIDEPDEIRYMCSRDKFAGVLDEIGDEYDNSYFKQASGLFLKSGNEFTVLCDLFIEYILNDDDIFERAREIILNIGSLEYEAYNLIKLGLKDF